MNFVKEKITYEDIKDLDIKKNDFILFKTKNSNSILNNEEFIYVDASAAKYLATMEVKGVGIDALGIERNQSDHNTRITFFKNDIMILEGLQLKK